MYGEMKVLLRDLDVIKQRRPFPNLALMKLSAYHKVRGDKVFLNFPLVQPDITYVSCVFTWNAKNAESVPPDSIIGGSGIDLKATLPSEVKHMMPDYNLYHNIDFSLGFTSRGCHRNCPWCVVPEKEGYITHWGNWYEFWDRRRHKKVVLLDNNFLADPTYRRTLRGLIKEQVEVDFNQGLDIRLVNENNVELLAKVKTHQLRFAFDNLAYEKALRHGISLLTDAGIRSRKLSFYVLVGFPGDNTAIERMKILASLNVDVFPMLYRGANGKEPQRQLLDVPDIFWHGSRRNINKFLRVVGRLPE